MTDLLLSPREYVALACNAECAEEQAKKTGRLLRDVRRNAMMSANQLAAKLDVPCGVIKAWESGELVFTPFDAYRVQNAIGMQPVEVGK